MYFSLLGDVKGHLIVGCLSFFSHQGFTHFSEQTNTLMLNGDHSLQVVTSKPLLKMWLARIFFYSVDYPFSLKNKSHWKK